MLKITALLLLFCTFIAVASTLNATLTKSFFFVNFYNQLSYKLFHTRNGIIAYSVETSQSTDEPFPQYLLLDYKTGYVTPILSDIMNSCNHTGVVVFDRLYYHAQTSTLVYYCTANNSLLLLDEEKYTVKSTIPIHLNETFAEAKLTGNGDFLYILAMGTLYSSNQTSQLVKIDLSTNKVQNKAVFNKGLAHGEIVNGFTIQGDPEDFDVRTYIQTNRITEDNRVEISIYDFQEGDTTYDLYPITNFTTRSYFSLSYISLSTFYGLGNYIVTNNDTDLIFFDTQGEIAYRVPGLYFKGAAYATGPYLPAMVTQEGSLDLYAMFDQTLVKLSVDGYLINAQEIANVSTMHIAYGNNHTENLMLTTSTDQLNFTIKGLENSKVVYTSLADYGGSSTGQTLMISNSTYGVFTRGEFYIFDLKSDQLIMNISRLYLWSFLYESNIFYYIDDLNTNGTCELKQLDLETLAMKTLYVYPGQDYCFGTITQFKFSPSGFPEHIISRRDDSFVIITESLGAVLFTPTYQMSLQDMIVYDFEITTLYLLAVDYFGNLIQVHYYDFNSTDFVEVDSYNITNTSVNTFYPIGDKKVVAVTDGYFTMIDLQFGSIGNYTLPTRTFSVSGFYDHVGRKHLIFSDQRISEYWTGNVSQSMLFDANGLNPIPGSTNFTVQARAAGHCSYSVVDGFVSSVGLVKFYNACSEQGKEEQVLPISW